MQRSRTSNILNVKTVGSSHELYKQQLAGALLISRHSDSLHMRQNAPYPISEASYQCVGTSVHIITYIIYIDWYVRVTVKQ